MCAVLIRWKKAFDAKVKEVQERIKRELEELEQRALDAAAERAKSAASSALANGSTAAHPVTPPIAAAVHICAVILLVIPV